MGTVGAAAPPSTVQVINILRRVSAKHDNKKLLFC